jgi:hypothetical protein
VIDKKAGFTRLPGMGVISSVRSKLRAHWFDWRHRVKTCGDDDLRQLTVVGENASHAITYIPTTPRTGRYILLIDCPLATQHLSKTRFFGWPNLDRA